MRFVQSVNGSLGDSRKIEGNSISLLVTLIVIYLLFPLRACAQSSASSGTVEGTVFVSDSGVPALLPGAKVILKGSATL